MFIEEYKKLAKQFIDDLKDTGHESESETFTASLINTFADFLSKRPYISSISDIRRSDIEEYIEYIWTVPYSSCNGIYRPSFVYRRLRALSHFFDYLTICEDELPENMIPASGLLFRSDFPSPNRRDVKHFPKWFDDYIHKKILEIPTDKKNIKFRTMMLFIYHTGARSFDVCLVSLRAVIKKYDRHWVRIFSKKLRREYEIPITDELYDAIMQYRHTLKDEIKKRKKQVHPITRRKTVYLFTNNGTPENFKNSFSQKLKKFANQVIDQAEAEGYDISKLRDLKVTSHKFRHSVAIKLIRMGADPLLVAEFLGHADLTMAQAYIQEDMDYIDEVYNELEEDAIEDFEPIILKKEDLLAAGDVVSKTNVGWCVHVGGSTLCSNDPYKCWECENLQPKKTEEYHKYLEEQKAIHEELLSRNIELGFDTAAEKERRVLNRICEFQNEIAYV